MSKFPHLYVTLTQGYANWKFPPDMFATEGEHVNVDQSIPRDPHLAARFFFDRSKFSFHKVMKQKFSVAEY